MTTASRIAELRAERRRLVEELERSVGTLNRGEGGPIRLQLRQSDGERVDIVAKMKRDWNRRARHDARFWIATNDFRNDAEFDSSGEATRLALLRLLGDHYDPGWTVLEVGCGIGRVLKPLARDFARLCGIDVAPEMIARSRDWLGGLSNVEAREGSGVDLAGFADRSFDLAFSYVAFQHMPRPVFAAYLAEINRVLRDGSLFALQVIVGRLIDPSFEDTITIRAYEPDELCAHLSLSGFELISDLPMLTPENPLASPFLLARRSRPINQPQANEWHGLRCRNEVSPLDDHLHLYLAHDQLVRGQRKAAIDTLSRLVLNSPAHLCGWTELVTLLLEEGQVVPAIDALERMLRANPEYEPARRHLSELHTLVRRPHSGSC